MTVFTRLKEILDKEEPVFTAELSSGTSTPEEVSQAVKYLLTTPEFNECPRAINSGNCDAFVDALANEIEGVDEMEHRGHVFARVCGRYYDAETPEGVDDWRDLPYFRREVSESLDQRMKWLVDDLNSGADISTSAWITPNNKIILASGSLDAHAELAADSEDMPLEEEERDFLLNYEVNDEEVEEIVMSLVKRGCIRVIALESVIIFSVDSDNRRNRRRIRTFVDKLMDAGLSRKINLSIDPLGDHNTVYLSLQDLYS